MKDSPGAFLLWADGGQDAEIEFGDAGDCAGEQALVPSDDEANEEREVFALSGT